MSNLALSGLPHYREFEKAFGIATGPKSAPGSRFSPYSDEGGTVAAIAGDNFVVIGCDTRLAERHQTIVSRNLERLFKLNDKVYLGATGFFGDTLQLVRVLQYRFKTFKYNFNEDLTVGACAEMLARTLYYKRFFPYYVSNVLIGLDSDGKGAIYGYDPVGCIEKLPYCVGGASASMIEPFLDNQVRWEHQTQAKPEMTLDRAVKLIKDAMTSAAERETSTGDQLKLIIMIKDEPIKEEFFPLRAD